MSVDELLTEANALFLHKKFVEANLLYDKVLQLVPDNLTALNNKGYSLNKLRKYQESILQYDLALKYFPNDMTLIINKISAFRKTKQYETALQYCNTILESKKSNIVLYHKERILFSLGRYEESITCCDLILNDYPKNIEVLFDKSRAVQELDKARLHM